MDEKGLGRRLQAARQAAGMTQQVLCHEAGLSYSTLAKIERGAIKSPSIFTIQNIAAALGTSLDVLLGINTATHATTQKNLKQTAANGVRFVYFDIHGCLVHFFLSAFTKLAHDNDLTPDAVETAFWHYNDRICRGQMTLDEFNDALAKRLGIKNVDWRHYYLEAIEPIKQMQELMTWTAERYHVGLLSNVMPGFIKALQDHHYLPEVPYDVIIDSSVVGAVKPEKKIYEIATERSGVKPAEIFFIDDSRPNLMAAESMGWRVLWFDGYKADECIERIKTALKPAED